MPENDSSQSDKFASDVLVHDAQSRHRTFIRPQIEDGTFPQFE